MLTPDPLFQSFMCFVSWSINSLPIFPYGTKKVFLLRGYLNIRVDDFWVDYYHFSFRLTANNRLRRVHSWKFRRHGVSTEHFCNLSSLALWSLRFSAFIPRFSQPILSHSRFITSMYPFFLPSFSWPVFYNPIHLNLFAQSILQFLLLF